MDEGYLNITVSAVMLHKPYHSKVSIPDVDIKDHS